ncbi:MAG: flagellar biosynthesis anti-sigma factor FlgM [Candidatus Syntropharchaeia archaeon]
MIERIEGPGGANPLKGPQSANVEKLKGKAVKKDELILEGSVQLKDMLEASKNSPDVREKLVEELRKAIEGGTYVVNVENIARRILEELEGR